ncbi:hypothetical protein Rhopal_003594-T1 [Rhodotorula paludigena]|uniref:Uncharacterized protein n=1 Tax=Rhodotorula paludigena TaxID=86838 RepID=A0AAV5GMJ9_9BASI|nr:hypothetical protein Rhopal_003594-T1 [Rhodotorula paludigena]
MSSTCEVVPGEATVVTAVETAFVPETQLSTAPGSTLTSSSAVVTSNCLLPTVLGELALCSTSTSFVPVETTVPGSVLTITTSTEPSEAEIRRSTSYITSYLTIVDSSGRTITSASAIPTMLNVAGSGGSGSNAGAIAGGTVGGVAALALAVFLVWLMRKKGFFRGNDDEIEEDVWEPRAHGQFYGGTGSRRSGGGGGGAAAVAGGRISPDEKASDEDRMVDAATLERHRSWYNSLRGHGDDHEDAYDGEMVQRAPSPGPNSAYGAAAFSAGPGSSGSHALQRSLSKRVSVYSQSSHSHETHAPRAPPIPLPPVPIPDHRLSQLSQYGYYQPFAPLPYGDAPVARYGSPPPGANPQPMFEHARSTSPPPVPLAPLPAHSPVSRQRSLPGLAIPAHVRAESYGPRPSLEVLQTGQRGPTSGSPSAAPSRARTNESFNTATTTPHSLSMPALSPSDSVSTLATPPLATPSPAAAPPCFLRGAPLPHQDTSEKPLLPVVPSLERLKAPRPAFGRTDSADSVLHPSQWLGARIANADDGSVLDVEAGEVIDAPGRTPASKSSSWADPAGEQVQLDTPQYIARVGG